MKHEKLDLSICQREADRLQPRFDAVSDVFESVPLGSPVEAAETELMKQRLIPYAADLYLTHRELGTENAIVTLLLNAKPSHGSDGVAALLISFCFSEDGLEIGNFIEEFNQRGLGVSRDELLAFGNETNAILNNAEHIEKLVDLIN